jgi:hypothetical protein
MTENWVQSGAGGAVFLDASAVRFDSLATLRNNSIKLGPGWVSGWCACEIVLAAGQNDDAGDGIRLCVHTLLFKQLSIRQVAVIDKHTSSPGPAGNLAKQPHVAAPLAHVRLPRARHTQQWLIDAGRCAAFHV